MDAPVPPDDGGPDGPIDDHDERLLAELAQLVDRLDPVPAGLVDRARFAVALEEVEVEVAHLLQTSSDRDGDLAGVRGATTDRSLTMTFAAASVTVTVAVTEVGRDRFRVDGWLTGGGEVDVTLRLPDTPRRQRVGDDGRFVFDDVPASMVQLVVAAVDGDGPAVVTPVFQL